MSTQMTILSGFLGAGKTTLIQKLLRETCKDEKVALVENDFGEISVDAALLRSTGIQVREINSGCICCTLSGDFVAALIELLQEYRPDRVIIEPSGVGKLSDILAACADQRIQPLLGDTQQITVVDVKRCETYLDNFGEFFENQILHADTLVLSRVEAYPEKVAQVLAVLREINPKARVFSQPWDTLDGAALLAHDRCPHCGGGHGHHIDHADHDQEHAHNHDEAHHSHHDADEAFDTVTLRLSQPLTRQQVERCLVRLEQVRSGTVLRAKGILPAPQGHWNVQYLPGDLRFSPCETTGDALCIIGHDLDRQELESLLTPH